MKEQKKPTKEKKIRIQRLQLVTFEGNQMTSEEKAINIVKKDWENWGAKVGIANRGMDNDGNYMVTYKIVKQLNNNWLYSKYVNRSLQKVKNKRRKMNKSFEETMEKLEQIVEELEKGNLNLDESVAKFEEGMQISKECNKMLKKQKRKYNIIKKDGEIRRRRFFKKNN